MKVQFLGTGSAEGVPGLFCQCDVCTRMREKGEIHSRSQYLIDEALGIEFPPDAYYHSVRFNVNFSKLRYLLITHSHQDHFYAHDFILRGYKYCANANQPLTIYGNAEVVKVFEECTRREMKPEVRANFTLVEVKPFISFSVGDNGEYTITPLPSQHCKDQTSFVYLIEKGEKAYLHLTDTGRLPMETLDYLEIRCEKRGAVDFITFDCTFLNATAGAVSRHMGLEDNKAMQSAFEERKIADGHTRYAITHFSHNGAPTAENLKIAGEKYGYIPAFDGMTVEI